MASCRTYLYPDTSLDLSSDKGYLIRSLNSPIERRMVFTSSEYTSLIPRSSSSSPVRFASSIAPKIPHPYASDTFLLASHFQSVVSEDVVLPRGSLDDRKRWMQRPAGRPLRSNRRSRHDGAYTTQIECRHRGKTPYQGVKLTLAEIG